MENESRYSSDEIGEKFQHYKNKKAFDISDREYGIFCDVISCICKEDVDKILNEVYFAVLSLDENVQPACYLHLETKGIFENKEAIIFLSPLVFDHTQGGLCHWYKDILHEVAHHVLGHRWTESEGIAQRQEVEARDKANQWIVECKGGEWK